MEIRVIAYLLCLLSVTTAKITHGLKDAKFQPQQVHIAYGDSIHDIVITWSTPKNTGEAIVNYGETKFTQAKNGTSSLFVDGGKEKRSMWIHRVYLNNLKHNTSYVYNCGSMKGWSNRFSFRTVADGNDWPIRIAMYGDLGLVNPQSLSRLQLETENGEYDSIIHVGDFAYDMDSDNSRVGDMFMQTIEPIAGYVPYMVCPGNHEEKYNFSNYRARFSMPNHLETESLFYSWDMGSVHFISINTEAYYFLQYGLKLLSKQYYWLKRDLEEANSPEARASRPWIVLYGHRPMYCSTSDGDDCSYRGCITRVGFPLVNWYGMEHLLMKYGVDLAVWAHEHSYERSWPLYDYTVMNGSSAYPYTNPRAPVHITTGSAGCKERHSGFKHHQPSWSAYRSNDYGYSRLIVANKTHLNIQQVSDDQNGKVIEDFWIIQEQHGTFEQ